MWKKLGIVLVVVLVIAVACGGRGSQVGQTTHNVIEDGKSVANNVTDFVSNLFGGGNNAVG